MGSMGVVWLNLAPNVVSSVRGISLSPALNQGKCWVSPVVVWFDTLEWASLAVRCSVPWSGPKRICSCWMSGVNRVFSTGVTERMSAVYTACSSLRENAEFSVKYMLCLAANLAFFVDWAVDSEMFSIKLVYVSHIYSVFHIDDTACVSTIYRMFELMKRKRYNIYSVFCIDTTRLSWILG